MVPLPNISGTLVKYIPGVLLILGGLWYIGHLQNANDQVQQQLRTQALVTENMAAEREATMEVLRERNDSIRVFRRRAFQAEVEANEVAEELDMALAANARVRLRVDTVEVASEAEVTGDSIRRAVFEAYQEPVHITADVVMPPVGHAASADFVLAFDPIPLTAHIGCLPPVAAHIAPATLALETPEWLVPQIDSVTVDPEVCNPVTDPVTPRFYEGWDAGVAGASSAFLLADGKPEAALTVAGLWAVYRIGKWVVER